MNKMKKTLSLILTIVFVISLSAFNVQAEETDGISGATAPVVEETPDNSEVPGDEAAAEEEVGETATATVIISLDKDYEVVVDGAGYVISIEEIEEKTAKGKSGEEASSTDDAAAEDEEGTSVDESNTEATTPDDTTIDASTDPEQEASTPTVEPKTLAQVIKELYDASVEPEALAEEEGTVDPTTEDPAEKDQDEEEDEEDGFEIKIKIITESQSLLDSLQTSLEGLDVDGEVEIEGELDEDGDQPERIRERFEMAEILGITPGRMHLLEKYLAAKPVEDEETAAADVTDDNSAEDEAEVDGEITSDDAQNLLIARYQDLLELSVKDLMKGTKSFKKGDDEEVADDEEIADDASLLEDEDELGDIEPESEKNESKSSKSKSKEEKRKSKK